MDLLFLFMKGLLIGFIIAAPVGPIGVLCIRRSLIDGKWSGFVSGLGAATADAIYGSIAAFGLSVISNILIEQKLVLQIIGGTFLIYLGIRTLQSSPAKKPANVKQGKLFSAYTSVFLLTLTNPMTILSFIAVFAGFGFLVESSHYVNSIFLVFGVFIGSAIWWLLLSMIAGFFRNKLNTQSLRWVNWLSGIVMLGFGAVAVFTSIISP